MKGERAIFVRPVGDAVEAHVETLDPDALPPGDLDVRVLYSSVNFKDALAVTGLGRVVRAPYPFVPGIDLVGEVVASRTDRFGQGDRVLQTGWGLGESRWGGFATFQRIRSDQVIRLPDGLTPEDAMLAGTAGLTAALAARALLDHGVEAGAEVLVTGASGGVGSFAVLLLSRLGRSVVAVTGKSGAKDYLHGLGARLVLGRAELSGGARQPLDSGRWDGCVDSVGGRTLEAVLSLLRPHGVVAACGLAGGAELETTVFPFILRGVSLLGIDSNTCPNPLRESAWRLLAEAMADGRPRSQVVGLDEVPRVSRALMEGRVTGRVVVRCAG